MSDKPRYKDGKYRCCECRDKFEVPDYDKGGSPICPQCGRRVRGKPRSRGRKVKVKALQERLLYSEAITKPSL